MNMFLLSVGDSVESHTVFFVRSFLLVVSSLEHLRHRSRNIEDTLTSLGHCIGLRHLYGESLNAERHMERSIAYKTTGR
jgi:hypothetical protein